MTTKEPLPKQVVRFYGNADFALEAIANRQLTFVHVSKLNDPFDPYFFFETDFENKYNALLDYVNEKHPDDFTWFIQKALQEDWDKSVNDIHSYLESQKQKTYVFSTSAPQNGVHPKDNLSLWGHYGNGHRGVAIEFDTHNVAKEEIARHKAQTGSNIQVSDVWVRMQYSSKLTPLSCEHFFQFFRNEKFRSEGKILKPQKVDLKEYLEMSIRTKSEVWKTENEWRLLWRNDETREKIQRSPISENAITSVFIGQNISSGAEADILFETRHKFPNALIFKAKKKFGAFASDFVPIN